MSEPDAAGATGPDYTRIHLRIGWWSVLCFLTLGLGLEWFHAAKLPWYLNEASESRRLMWTLAHAHGVIIGLVHLAFAATVGTVAAEAESVQRIASACLTSAGVLLPVGFLLGGAVIQDGDPGQGVFLVPIGAVFLVVAVLLAARLVGSRGRHGAH